MDTKSKNIVEEAIRNGRKFSLSVYENVRLIANDINLKAGLRLDQLMDDVSSFLYKLKHFYL